MSQRPRTIFGVPRNVFFLGLTSLLNDASSEMIFPLIPLFLTSVLRASFGVVGVIEGVAEATASLAKIPSGWLSDKLRARKALTVAGYGLSAVAKPLLAFATAASHVLAVRFTDRLGKGIRTAPRDALIAASTDRASFGRSFGFHRAMDTMGAIVGPVLAAMLLPLLNFRGVFLVSFVASAIAVFVLIVFVREAKPEAVLQSSNAPAHSAAVPWADIFTRRFTLFLIAATIFSIGNSSDAFLLLRARSLGVALVLIPLAYGLFNVVYALLAVPAGILSDRIGRRRMIALGFAIFGVAYLGFARAGGPAAVWLLFPFYGFYAAVSEGNLRAFVADLVDDRHRGTAFGVFAAATGLALLPASIIAGFLWDRFGPAAPFGYGATTAFAAAILMLFVPHQQGSTKQQASNPRI